VLLLHRRRYRHAWERRAAVLKRDRVSHAAVARVLAEHLWQQGAQSPQPPLARELKDRVGRALNGATLTAETLSIFIDAFDIAKDEQERLWFLYSGAADQHTLRGFLADDSGNLEVLAQSKYVTLATYDLHRVDGDGAPVHHRTIQVVKAVEEGLDRISCRFESHIAEVNVIRGGTVSTSYRLRDHLRAVDIILPRALREGETASLEYEARIDPDMPPATEFRRIVPRRLENCTMVLQFNGHRRPSKVAWAVWDSLAAPPTREEQVALELDGSVHRHLSSIEEAIFGFRWTW